VTWIEYFRSVAVWSLGEGQACRARWGQKGLRRSFLARYATLRYLIQDFQFIVLSSLALGLTAGVLLQGAVLLVAAGGAAAITASVAAWAHRRRRSWREALFDLHGAFYGPYRQFLFAMGLLRSSPPPESYPQDVEIQDARTVLP